MSDQGVSLSKQLSRRHLGKIALGTLGATQLGWSRFGASQKQATSTAAPQHLTKMRLGCACVANATDEDLLFYKQVGVDCVHVSGRLPEYKTVEGMLSVKKRFSDAGLVIDSVKSDAVDSLVADSSGRSLQGIDPRTSRCRVPIHSANVQCNGSHIERSC